MVNASLANNQRQANGAGGQKPLENAKLWGREGWPGWAGRPGERRKECSKFWLPTQTPQSMPQVIFTAQLTHTAGIQVCVPVCGNE